MNQIRNQKKIAIIGAGISGISAAMELLDKNAAIDIFDAKTTIGGRVSGIRDHLTDDKIDNGKHLMVGAYSNFFELLSKLGTLEHLYFQKFFSVNFLTKSKSFNFSYGRFGKLSQFLSLLNLPDISLNDKRNAVNFLDKMQKGILSTSKTALEILHQFKFSDKIIEILWRPLILATMNTQPEIASGDIFINILKLAFFRDNNSARLVFSNVPLNELLIPFFDKFPNENRNINFQKIVASVDKIDDNKFKIKLKSGDEYTYDAVIFALTPFALKKIETNFHIPSLEEFEPSPIVSLYMWSEEDFMKEDFYALIGSNFQWIFREYSRSLRYTLTISGADNYSNLSKNEIIEFAFRDLEQTFPNFNRNFIYHSQVIIEKQATIKLTPNAEQLRPIQKVSNGIYLAGDWTKTGLPATMESAALSGKLASRYLTTDLSL